MAKKKKGGGAHATNSFAQLVSKAQLEALKPYIQQQMGMIAQQIVNYVIKENSQIQLRQLAIEDLLKEKGLLSQDDIAAAIAKQEDSALGYVESKEPIQEGDLVRLEVQSKLAGEADFSKPEKLRIQSVLSKNNNGEVQTFEELEKALLGKSAGDLIEVTIPKTEDDEAGEDMVVKAKIVKVSYSESERAKLKEVQDDDKASK